MTVDEPSEFGLRVSPTAHSTGITEERWLTATDPRAMLDALAQAADRRKFRLFDTACCRELGRHLRDPRVVSALDAADRHADGRIAAGTLKKWRREVVQAQIAAGRQRTGRRFPPEYFAYHFVAFVTYPRGNRLQMDGVDLILRHWRDLGEESEGEFRRRFADLLRDVFGNPFRPVAFDPAWRTSTAVALARRMYESREFSAMPILADALQDAGCENADILGHCRGPGPHVRGCWAVDLVLGKS